MPPLPEDDDLPPIPEGDEAFHEKPKVDSEEQKEIVEVPAGEFDPAEPFQSTSAEERRKLHCLTHMPKDPACEVCRVAKLYNIPARKLHSQSEKRQADQQDFVSTRPFDLLCLDLKIVTKGGSSRQQECFLNILDVYTGASLSYSMKEHSTATIRKCLLHFAGRAACRYIIRGMSGRADE